MGHVTRKSLRWHLSLVFVVALVSRIAFFFFEPWLHPDEFFQYLEPPQWHLTGFGWKAWEWRDGIRSWVMPAYHGGWLALLRALGVRDGRTLLAFFQLHWAVVSVLLPCGAFRAGRVLAARVEAMEGADVSAGSSSEIPGWFGGLLAAWAVALFPPLLYFAPRMLTEVPSMIAIVWGYTFALESHDKAGKHANKAIVVAGLLLSFGAWLRLPNAPLIAFPLLELLIRKRVRHALFIVGSFVLVGLAFGMVDLLTWGRMFHSVLAFINYNFIQGRAAEHGVEPPFFYAEVILRHSGWALPFALAMALRGIKVNWTFLAGALSIVLYLTTQPHKEERFIIAIWPLFLIASASTAGALVFHARHPLRARALLTLGCVIALGQGIFGVSRLPRYGHAERYRYSFATAWTGQRPDATGVLVEDHYQSGGHFCLGSTVPLVGFRGELLLSRLFNYAVVRKGSTAYEQVEQRGFRSVSEFGAVVVMKR